MHQGNALVSALMMGRSQYAVACMTASHINTAPRSKHNGTRHYAPSRNMAGCSLEGDIDVIEPMAAVPLQELRLQNNALFGSIAAVSSFCELRTLYVCRSTVLAASLSCTVGLRDRLCTVMALRSPQLAPATWVLPS